MSLFHELNVFITFQKGAHFAPTLVIQHDSRASNQDQAIASTLELIKNQGSPVYAILPGGDTGVVLAERYKNDYYNSVTHTLL